MKALLPLAHGIDMGRIVFDKCKDPVAAPRKIDDESLADGASADNRYVRKCCHLDTLSGRMKRP